MISTFAIRYSLRFGLQPVNVLTEARARALHLRGEEYSIIIGNPDDPSCHLTISKLRPIDYRLVKAEFFHDRQSTCVYFMDVHPEKTKRNDLLLRDYRSYPGNDGPRFYQLFVADVYVDGDLPTLTFDEIGSGGESHAISVPVDDFFLGPFPDFDELASGRFLARLPKITVPPRELWTDYIPQSVRTPKTPKRTPIGHFPW